MEVTILQAHLEKAVLAISRIISQKVQLPILSNVLLTATSGELTLSATNLNESITLSVPAKVSQEGQLTVPGKLFAEFVHLLPQQPVTLTAKGQALHVVCENAQADFAGISAAEFPRLPVADSAQTASLPLALLEQVVSLISFAASKDESRPHLTGVLVTIEEETITFVATDGFRLSLVTKPFKGVKEKHTILLPAKTLEEVVRLAKDFSQTKDVAIALTLIPDQNQAIMRFGNIEFSSRIIEGKFPDYEKVIPQDTETTVTLGKDDLLQSVRLASVFSRDSMSVIKMAIGLDAVTLTSDAKEIGNDIVKVAAGIEGEPQETAFNPRFLLELLQNVPAPDVTIQMAGSLSAVVFKITGDDSFLHIIMPVRT